MKNQNWKVGDWGFFEFELAYIKEMEDGNIIRIGTGQIETWGSSLGDRFFPLDVATKQISDTVEYWSNRFHRDCKGLNYPDINRKLVQLWCDAIEVKDNEEKLKKAYEKINLFGNMVIEKSRDKNRIEVDGVEILK